MKLLDSSIINDRKRKNNFALIEVPIKLAVRVRPVISNWFTGSNDKIPSTRETQIASLGWWQFYHIAFNVFSASVRALRSSATIRVMESREFSEAMSWDEVKFQHRITSAQDLLWTATLIWRYLMAESILRMFEEMITIWKNETESICLHEN